MTDPRRTERIADLLTERLDRELSFEETQELNTLLAEEPSWSADDFEVAAAATFVAFHGSVSETLPADVAARVAADAGAVGPESAGGTSVASRGPEAARGPSLLVQYGGWIAAAASLLLALYLGQRPSPALDSAPPGVAVPTAPPRPSVRTPSEQRADMIKRSGVVRRDWSPTKDPLAVSVEGDVVWHPQEQKGYMRFSGLPRNDPAVSQYQLWIFDAERDERHPVDGGVFDIESDTGEAVVAIEAKLKVHRATLFAVTLEPPGGVVVSSRERLVVLAQVEG